MTIISTEVIASNNSVESMVAIMHGNTPVITTELLAHLYGTDTDNIKKNYSRNAERFIEGKHYFKLTGNDLRSFKHKVTDSPFVKIAGNVRHLMLWTERGSARHAKIIETDKAWDIFEKLEDHYFNQSEPKPRKQPKQIAGRITQDQQEAIKQLVLNRGKALPKESQAKAMITMWSALKTHFGCTYKEIESEQFTEALSLAARVPLEGELLAKEELPAPVSQPQISDSDLQTLCWLWQHSVDMANYMMNIEPLLQLAEHKLAGAYATHPQIAIKCANSARQILEKASEHIQIRAIQMDNWMVLHNLRKPNYPF